MAEKFSLKDELFNATKVKKIALEIKNIFDAFEEELFQKEVLEKFPHLELKERIYHIRDCLKKYLPSNYVEATTLLLKSLPPPLDPTKKDDDFGDFIYAPYSDFVLTFGCSKEHLAFSLEALREMTKCFSVEFSIREFINTFPKETFKMLEDCSISSNYHERRLATEGSRPKLPWAKKLNIHYSKPLFLLDTLYQDKTRYVTRSVANHLNDIAKIDASLVIDTLKRWKNSKQQNEKEMLFIMTHSLRTLIKDGNTEALELLGYKANPNILLEKFRLKETIIKVGEVLEFDFVINVMDDEKLMIDYLIYFQTKSGTLSSKVHKLKKLTIKQDTLLEIDKKHLFKANMTTRKFYEGEHKIALQINGKIYQEFKFTLEL